MLGIKRFAVLLLALYGCAGVARAEHLLRIGYYDFAPSIYTDEKGQAVGPLVELVERVFARTEYQPLFKRMPIARVYNHLRTGRIDIWVGAPNKDELNEYVIHSQQQLAEVALNLYYRPDTQPPKLPDDLKGRVMILLTGYSYWPKTNALLLAPEQGILQLRTSKRESAFELLARKRGDYLLDYQVPANEVLKEMGVSHLPYVRVESLPIVFVGSRQTANMARILDELDRAYLSLVAEGQEVALPN